MTINDNQGLWGLIIFSIITSGLIVYWMIKAGGNKDERTNGIRRSEH